MKPLRAYLDTSVIGGRFDEEFADQTLVFIQAIEAGKLLPVVSDAVRAELLGAPHEVVQLLAHLDTLQRFS